MCAYTRCSTAAGTASGPRTRSKSAPRLRSSRLRRRACPKRCTTSRVAMFGSPTGVERHRIQPVADLARADHLRDDLERPLARVGRLAPAPVRDRELHFFAGAERDAVQRGACFGAERLPDELDLDEDAVAYGCGVLTRRLGDVSVLGEHTDAREPHQMPAPRLRLRRR